MHTCSYSRRPLDVSAVQRGWGEGQEMRTFEPGCGKHKLKAVSMLDARGGFLGPYDAYRGPCGLHVPIPSSQVWKWVLRAGRAANVSPLPFGSHQTKIISAASIQPASPRLLLIHREHCNPARGAADDGTDASEQNVHGHVRRGRYKGSRDTEVQADKSHFLCPVGYFRDHRSCCWLRLDVRDPRVSGDPALNEHIEMCWMASLRN